MTLIRRTTLAVVAMAMSTSGAAAEPPVVSYGLDYTLVSDYIWRGQNLSDYPGRSGRKPNHQLDVYGSVNTEMGTFGGGVWFQWNPDHNRVDPGSSGTLQEVDYCVSYSREFGPVEAEVGWILYTFPKSSDSSNTTNEVYVSLALDDSGLFDASAPVLNPSVTWYMDLDDNRHGSWFELAVSHVFEPAAHDIPYTDHVTVVPSLTLGIDHRFTRATTRLGNLQYALDLNYDVSTALDMPEQYGDITVTGFVAFSQAFADDLLNDEFWAGITLSWAR